MIHDKKAKINTTPPKQVQAKNDAAQDNFLACDDSIQYIYYMLLAEGFGLYILSTTNTILAAQI